MGVTIVIITHEMRVIEQRMMNKSEALASNMFWPFVIIKICSLSKC